MKRNAHENKLTIWSFEDDRMEYTELDLAKRILQPLFQIGEVAKMLNRKANTLHKYERAGLIDRPLVIKKVNNSTMRLYSKDEVLELTSFFALRKPPGVEPKTDLDVRRNFRIDRISVENELKMRYEN